MSGTEADFLWGVATSGYQHEGGYNGSGQPQNNWSQAEAVGRVMKSGKTAEFWTRYSSDFDLCRSLGLNAFRLSLEWTRIQPTTDPLSRTVPEFDRAALDKYAEILASCRQHGMEPVVTLFHFAHPAWLGPDPWLADATVGPFTDFVQTTVAHINHRLTERHGTGPLRWYVTINEPNILVLNSYLGRQFPAEHTSGQTTLLRAYNRLLAAHVRAYNVLHDLHEAAGWPPPRVGLNTYCNDLYWNDKLIWDLLAARWRGVKPAHLRDYIYARAKDLDAALQRAKLPFQRDLAFVAGRVIHGLADWIGFRTFDGKHFAFYLAELAAAKRPTTFDFLGLDYYDPFTAHAIRLPTFADLEFKSKSLRAWLMEGVTSKWWNWRNLPDGLHFFCKHYSEDMGDAPVLIAENGMALRRKADNSAATSRVDRLRRSEYLSAHVRQVMRLTREGVPVQGYLHWSLVDNYEWGSFSPRFGLYTIDYTKDASRLAVDHLGDRPSETYARLVREARTLE